jgi:hypothetical protein
MIFDLLLLLLLLDRAAGLDLSSLFIAKCNDTVPLSCVFDGQSGQFVAFLGAAAPTCARADAKTASVVHSHIFRWVVQDHLFAVGFCAGGVGRVSVVSVAAQRELAFANSPALNSVVVFPRASNVTFHASWNVPADATTRVVLPSIALSYDTAPQDAPNVCVFDPTARVDQSVPACGVGFRAVPLGAIAAPTEVGYGAVFREVGAAVHDSNGDGWQDIVLYFHAMQVTVSTFPGASPTILRRVAYDVGAADGATAAQVHSGRSYGVWALRGVGTTSGTFATVGIGGVPTGEFADYNCNVSRFVAMIGALGRMWSRYIGFASSIWSNYDAAQCGGAGGLACLLRPGDFTNRCVHRFDHGVGVTDDNVAVIAYNHFVQTSPDASDNSARCLAEQYALYQEPTWTTAKSDTWYSCVARKHALSRGYWATAFLHLWNGTAHTGAERTYVWGTARKLTPAQEGTAYLVELQSPGIHPFDLSSNSTAPALQVMTLRRGLFSLLGVFPPGRPKIRRAQPADASIEADLPEWNVGVAAGSFVSMLTTRQNAASGLTEVQLLNGAWVGWNGTAFVEQRLTTTTTTTTMVTGTSALDPFTPAETPTFASGSSSPVSASTSASSTSTQIVVVDSSVPSVPSLSGSMACALLAVLCLHQR